MDALPQQRRKQKNSKTWPTFWDMNFVPFFMQLDSRMFCKISKRYNIDLADFLIITHKCMI